MEQSEENRDYYRVLGVPPSADQETIGKAYRSRMKAVHPDARRGKSDPDTGRKVAELVEAWRVLGDPAKRFDYDRSRLVGGKAPSNAKGGQRAAQRAPVLEIEPRSLDLGVVERGEVAKGLVRLYNRGGPATSAERLDPPRDWIAISRAEQDGPRGSFPMGMSVQVNTAELVARHRHQEEVVFRLASSPSGLRSPEETVVVSLVVAPKRPPLLAVRPAGWVVNPCQCEGAPRSLVLHLFILNEGSASLSASVLLEPWMRVTPREFGPQAGDAAPTHLSVEVDCHEWAASGWPDGRVVVTTGEGDLLEVAVIAGESLRQGPKFSTKRLQRLGVCALGAIVPALTMMTGLWELATAAAMLAALSLPSLIQRLWRQEVLSYGTDGEAVGWGIGPRGSGPRLLLLALGWGILGALLFAASGARTTGGLPASVQLWIAALAGVIVLMSVAARDGWLLRPGTRSKGARSLWLGFLGVAIAGAWTFLGALLAQSVAGRQWTDLGAVAGWLVGSLLMMGRNPDMRTRERRAIARLVWGLVPVVSSGAAFAVALAGAVDWGLGPRGGFASALSRLMGAGSSPLLGLPATSLGSSLMAFAALTGLLMGLGLGLATVLPIIDGAASGLPADWSGRRMARGRVLVEELFLRHAGVDDLRAVTGESSGLPCLARGLISLHWSTLAVGTVAALLLIYATAHLLLAVVAVVGIIVG